MLIYHPTKGEETPQPLLQEGWVRVFFLFLSVMKVQSRFKIASKPGGAHSQNMPMGLGLFFRTTSLDQSPKFVL